MRLVANIHGSSVASSGGAIAFLTAAEGGRLLSIVSPRGATSRFITLKVVDPTPRTTAPDLRGQIDAGIAVLMADPGCPAHLLQHLRRAASALPALQAPAKARVEGLSTAQLKIAKDILSSRLEHAVTISDVATACGISRGHLNRGFRQMVGTPPMRWRLDVRLDLCRRLLMESELPVAAVARSAGFSDPCYFSRAFAQASGVSPRDWRRIFREKPRQAAVEAAA